MSIELQAVTKIFEDPAHGSQITALESISLSVGANEFCALLGPSGCGKTTILNLIAGFDSPSQGTVVAGGEIVTAPSPERGVIFQSSSLFPWLSTMDNLLFGPRVRGRDMHKARVKAAEILALVGLTGFEGHRPHELSGGMQQRVAIGRVLMNEPSILLADEPFAALDEYTRRLMQEEFIRIWRRTHATVVFVTHNIEEAIYLADRIVVMSRNPGRINTILEVQGERPRDRTSNEFVHLTREALNLIQPEVVTG